MNVPKSVAYPFGTITGVVCTILTINEYFMGDEDALNMLALWLPLALICPILGYNWFKHGDEWGGR
jgi:hypothetical protein